MLDYDRVPEHMRDGLRRYIEDGIKPGSFLLAVMCNDFVNIFGNADEINLGHLRDWAMFLYNELPARGTHDPDCWGSYEAVINWIEIGGLHGLAKAEKA